MVNRGDRGAAVPNVVLGGPGREVCLAARVEVSSGLFGQGVEEVQ